MLALISSKILKVILIVFSSLLFNWNMQESASVGGLIPSVTMEGGSETDSLDAGEKDESKKSVKISISDDGIKVQHGDKDKFIINEKNIQSMVEKGIKSLDAESLMLNIGIHREERYTHEVRGNRVKVGSSVEVEDYELIQGDAVSVFGGLTVDGKVRGDAVSVFGNLELGPTAVVNGDVVCVLGHLEKDDKAMVRGETISIGSANMADVGITPPVILPFFPFRGGVFKLFGKVTFFVIGILLILLVVYFIPERMDKSSDYIEGSFMKSIGLGALVFVFGSILVLIVAVIIGITIIGIPVSILLILCYVAFMFLGYFIGAFALGRVISRKFGISYNSRYVQGIIGLFVLAVFGIFSAGLDVMPHFSPMAVLISLIGKFISFLALLAGVGAFILSRAGTVSFQSREPTEQ